MPILHLIILAVVQGITEFLPVSSSGHLVVAHAVMNGHDALPADNKNDLLIDLAVHVGTLLSVLLYFRKDVFSMVAGAASLFRAPVRSFSFLKNGISATGGIDKSDKGTQLLLLVFLGSIPVLIAGLIMHMWSPDWMRSPMVMACSTIIFGILLWWADAKKPDDRTLEKLSLKDALFIGASQILALVPGTSRSGITMTAGRYLGYTREESARFSLLLAIVVISAAGVLGMIDILQSGNIALGRDSIMAAALSFICGWFSIAVMMKFLERCTFKVFAIYRVVMGIGLLALIYGGVL